MKEVAGVQFPEQVLTPADGAKMSIKRKKTQQPKHLKFP